MIDIISPATPSTTEEIVLMQQFLLQKKIQSNFFDLNLVSIKEKNQHSFCRIPGPHFAPFRSAICGLILFLAITYKQLT